MVCSLFTFVTFSVSAYANIDGYPDFDVDIYVAGLMTDSDNPLFSTIDNQISLASPNDVVIKQLKEDTGFQASYAAWQIATFKGGDAVSDPLTEVGYYQSLIINTISEALTSSNAKNAFDNTVIKDAKHLQSTFTNILKLEFVFTDLNDLNVAEMSQEEQIKVMDAFSSSFKKTYPAVSDVGKFVSVFSTIVKEGKALETAINNLVAYTESVGMNDYMKAVVSDLYKNCDSSNVAMKSALFEIDKACQSYELAYSAATFDAATSSLSVVCEKVVNTMVDGIMAANPAGLSIMIGQAIGKGVANFLFSTDAICEQYHKMCCLYEFEELLGKVAKLEMDSFTKSKTNYNANKIFSVVDFLYKEYDVSCNLAKKYADIIFKESIAGVFILNSDGYNKYISSVESLRSIAEDNYEFLKGDAWMCFLEEDYPDIYNALIKEDEEIKNPYIPVTRIAFEKESVEWGTQDTFLNNDKATINPSNASSKGIEYTSSDPSVVSYNKFGAVVHKAGTATVTATSVSSGLTATLNVTVVDGNGADGIALEDPKPDDNIINIGEQFTVGNIIYQIISEDAVELREGKTTGKVVIPETIGYKSKLFGVTSIGSFAFDHCNLISVTIPNSVTVINDYAFRESGLTSLTIPNSVNKISYGAFYGCSLKTIAIPDSVKTIKSNAFAYCSLNCIIISDKLTNRDASAFWDNCIKNIIIAEGSETVTSKMIISDKGDRSKIEKVIIPNSVDKIGEEAFRNCSSLTQIELPECISIISNRIFDGCTNLKQVKIGNKLMKIGSLAFNGCSNLNNVTIPESVTSIGVNAFAGCSNLTNITIPEGVMSIENSVFKNCTSLKSVTIKGKVTSIGSSAFCNCTSLKSVNLPNSITSISIGAFDGCTSLTNITIPNRVNSIESAVFKDCTSLKSVAIPYSVTKIRTESFLNCYSITNVVIPDSVTSIGSGAFNKCKNLKSIFIPHSVKNIEGGAFQGCDVLTIYGYSDSCAEKYAENNNIKFITLNVIRDTESDISVTTTSNAELIIDKLTDSECATDVIAVLDESEKLVDLYDIFLTNEGETVQPDGIAMVKIPTDNENAKVYRIKDDGTATDMNAVYDNGYMVFTTEHFTLYALVIPNDNVIGDVNGDGEISVVDATELQKYLVGLSSLSVDQLAVADANGDGKISIIDATEIQKYLVGLVSSLG